MSYSHLTSLLIKAMNELAVCLANGALVMSENEEASDLHHIVEHDDVELRVAKYQYVM